MKKVICIFLALVFLLSFSTLIAGAATDTSSVMSDLSRLKIDGETFSEEKHLSDAAQSGLTLITVVESNYVNSSYSPKFNLYFYVYNPEKIQFTDSVWDSVNLATDDKVEGFKKYGLQVLFHSDDWKFLKLGMVDSTTFCSRVDCYTSQANSEERVYNVASIHLTVDGVTKGYPIGQAFIFSGFQYADNLKCESKTFHAETITLHDASWISPNAGFRVDGRTASNYDHYEIHTVYFTLPNSLFKTKNSEGTGYDFLKSVRASYDEVHLTPIILTRENDYDFSDEKGQATKNMILSGKTLQVGGSVDTYDLFLKAPFGEVDAYLYSEKSADYYNSALGAIVDSIFGWWNGIDNLIENVNQYNTLAYYFASLPLDFEYSDGASIAEGVVSSEELKEYYDSWVASGKDESRLYSEINRQRDIDLYSVDADAKAVYNMTSFETMITNSNFIRKWWAHIATEKDSYLYDDFGVSAPILEVIDPTKYANLDRTNTAKVKDIADNELYIGVNDLTSDGGFFDLCEDAVRRGEQVVVLRLGFKDYRCQPVRDCWEASNEWGPLKGLWIDKWAYRNISVGQAVFFNDGADIIVPLVSNQIDSMGDLDGFGDAGLNKDDVISGVKKAVSDLVHSPGLRILFLITAVVVVLLLVVWVFLKLKPQKIKIEYPDQDKRRKRRK